MCDKCNCAEKTDSAPVLKVSTGSSGQAISYANPGDAGADLRSAEDVTLFPGQRKLVHCGIKIALPKGSVGLVCPRSGLAGRHGITVVNAPGIIDEGYRGEVMVVLLNTDDNASFQIKKGDWIAQLVVVPYMRCEIAETDDLGETERGERGFGSTGRA